ncbi:5-oxoprolinase subunit B family protein [Vibrio harveyi]|uniref:5-oxoprolinase subunit B family protein n=1 Tax=Vibrio harveyi TaxID=669 RepID=UPI00093875F0|nr:carboxyltransferase domain-containing protein [Vibrio harveyi]APP07779.1 allophanate hydrolase [Vibrio harveyi]ELC3157928.1 carboxyltransferase domain-containing protein [Vibrio harveyi]HDM8147426.1 carboxyltransferase domain-containing protein [Vibrio harveyi]HDM8152874.1 carboxyltransferase domain-containing protein [Vibrio harveyi]
MNQGQFSISPISECSILIRFHETVTVEHIGELAHQIADKLNLIIMNVVPSYRTILIDYLPFRINESIILKELNQLVTRFDVRSMDNKQPNYISIPVYYSEETALDLERFNDAGLPLAELIELHTKTVYTVSAIGFAPGFAFLSDLPKALHMPRHNTPRTHVPAGSVAIADSKTAVYPSDSPGGWNIIGRTPISLFTDTPPFIPFEVGDKVTFGSITRQEYINLGGKL